jgi:hypothetical protein
MRVGPAKSVGAMVRARLDGNVGKAAVVWVFFLPCLFCSLFLAKKKSEAPSDEDIME